jgi:hypothetical protein
LEWHHDRLGASRRDDEIFERDAYFLENATILSGNCAHHALAVGPVRKGGVLWPVAGSWYRVMAVHVSFKGDPQVAPGSCRVARVAPGGCPYEMAGKGLIPPNRI